MYDGLDCVAGGDGGVVGRDYCVGGGLSGNGVDMDWKEGLDD